MAETASAEPVTGRAIVCHGPAKDGKWKIEDVRLRPIKDNELVVKIVASGICHTDLVVGDADEGFGVFYPSIKGHEGAGYVQQIGSKVTVAQPGDPVLLSFAFCATCALCTSGHPAHCIQFHEINVFGRKDKDFSLASSDTDAEPQISGCFFGQSSFASMSIVSERSVVNVKGLLNDEELKMFAPLGCGIQTGSGSIVNIAAAAPEDTVAIIGAGGVGMSAIMAAKMRGCRTIIAIDRVESRLELAKQLGATHVINTATMSSLDEVVPAVTGLTEGLGSSITVDTTGFLPLIQKSIDFTRPRGKILQIGVAPMDGKLEIPPIMFMVTGKQYIGVIEGDVVPSNYVPEMIRWYREGKFPVDRIVKFFKAEEFEKAIHEMHTGGTVKPVIVW
ncbi:hypothetical protein W97_09145 [Coniosporium apollinis CBS 100218]|uniref:Enoyl reductase (ER) domain-containing protein n=1 Tax=Coniosporium apollinis (strain CBS 100218) TaxID=1168221 RepID=R7Z7G0_CONA1|nr:uncharacterized protein W97_09145 [Coniosporium apollinis CBS 100218]EON69881.1 hypothetical protein W97_09145 [Coniosporium apollinis CBS 100218]